MGALGLYADEAYLVLVVFLSCCDCWWKVLIVAVIQTLKQEFAVVDMFFFMCVLNEGTNDSVLFLFLILLL